MRRHRRRLPERLAGEDASTAARGSRVFHEARSVRSRRSGEEGQRPRVISERWHHVELRHPVPGATGPRTAQQRERLLHAVFQQFSEGDQRSVVALFLSGSSSPVKKASQASTVASLLRQAELDVDALDAVGVLRHARQRDHHVPLI